MCLIDWLIRVFTLPLLDYDLTAQAGVQAPFAQRLVPDSLAGSIPGANAAFPGAARHRMPQAASAASMSCARLLGVSVGA